MERELEELLKAKGIDSPELDMLWPEYLYLRKRLEELFSSPYLLATMLATMYMYKSLG